MTFKNKTVQKFISSLLIIAVLSPAGFLLLSKPQKTEAVVPSVDVVDAAPTLISFIEATAKEILKQFLMTVARKLIDKMTQSTINWINSGFHGAPLFIENPGSFFKDVVHTELQGFINEIAYDPVKFPFGRDYALGIADQAKSTFAQNAEYSLSKMYGDSAEFYRQQNDFAAGGWNGLLLNTQLMQNNFIGFGITADNEVDVRINGQYSAVQKIKDQIQQGMGFLSQQVCKSNPNWDPDKLREGPPPPGPDDDATDPQAELVWWNNHYGCPEGPATSTPGSVAADSIMNALGSKQRQGELGAALGNSLSAIFDALINKLFDTGLTALTNFTTPQDPNNTNISDFNIYGDTTGNNLGNTGDLVKQYITVIVDVINDNGGTLSYNDPTLQVFIDSNTAAKNTPNSVSVGSHVVLMNDISGYNKTIGGDCAADGSVTIASAGQKTCSVTFDDIFNFSPTKIPKLTVTVVVTNDNGGTLSPSDVHPTVDGTSVTSGVQNVYSVGNHFVSPATVTNYTSTITGNCDSSGNITLIIGDTKTCVIMYNDN